MKPWFVVLLCFLNVCALSQIRVRDCTIGVPEGASQTERFAAQELQKYLSQIVGLEIPLKSPPPMPEGFEGSARRPLIIVGRNPAMEAIRLGGIDWAKLGDEQTLIKTSGNILEVSGGRPRGALYAVYRLLQKYCGVRWWAPWAIDIPKNPNLTFGKIDDRETPAFEVRDSYWHHSFDTAWALPNFDNGFNVQADDGHGGKTQYAGGFVHTYYPLVPPDKYFAAHPEWYSLINGKRTHDDAQLCTTNPELRDFIVQRVKEELRANPLATIVSVSQNDCFNPCQCPVCRALAAQEGSDAALTLDLANYVADHIKDEFPNVVVDTLAYQWSRHPPKTMKPRPNVAVRLCSIECNFADPLFAPSNKAFADDIEGWHKLTNRLYIWDYCTDFANYLQPEPDYFSLGPTLQWFARNGVKGVFEEGDYTSTGGDMAELKAWLIAQMLWDPSQDPDKLIHEFLAGYYGPAAEPIYDYLRLVSDAAKGVHVSFAMGHDAPFLNYDTMSRSLKLWRDAERRVATDSEKLARVRMSELSVQFVWLTHWQQFRDAATAKGDPWPLAPTLQEAAQAWLLQATGPNRPTGYPAITAVDEGNQSPQAFVSSLVK